MRQTYTPARTAQRAIKLLEVLGETQPAPPSELVRRLGIPRSTVHRLLATLEDMGYVEKVPGAKYRLAFKLFILGNSVLRSRNLSEVAKPYLSKLADISQENVNLAILYEQKVLYIDKIESKHYFKLDQPVGGRDFLHCTALGKALLSGLDEDELPALLHNLPLVSLTKNTMINPDALIREIRKVKTQGYATDLEELTEGVRCIAAPICDHTQRVIAAISISAPAVRLTNERMKEMKTPLLEAAAEISQKMGFHAMRNAAQR